MDSNLVALKDFGYQFLGPMCTRYFESLKTLIDTHEANNESEEAQAPISLVFLAREGYFFKRAYDALVKQGFMPDIERCYLRVSRTFLFRICVTDSATWDISLGHKYKGTLETLLTHRFGFSGNQARYLFSEDLLEGDIELPLDLNSVKSLFEERLALLNELTIDSRTDYLSYLRGIGLFESNLPVMIDVGYSGTIQKLLTILLSKNTEGLYFMTTKGGEHSLGEATATMHPVFQDEVAMGEGYLMLDRSLFIESLLTSPNGQFLDIYARHPALELKEPYQFVYGRESYTQTHFFELSTVHDGAIEAVLHNLLNNIHYSTEEIEDMYALYTGHRHMMPSSAYPLFDVDDAISGNGNVNPMSLFGL